MLKEHRIIQLIYLDIKSKDIYIQRPLLQANELIYDNFGKGRPIYIPSDILKNIKLNDEIPLIFGHKNKYIKLGRIENINYDARNKLLLGDINVYPRWNEWVLRKFSEGINGLSTEFKSYEKNEKYFDRIIGLTLERVAIVDRPASHRAKMY